MKGLLALLCAFSLSLLLPGMAEAQKKAQKKPKPTKKTRMYVRASVLHLQPNVSSDEVQLTNLSEFAQLAIAPGPIAGSGVDVDSVTTPVLILGYVLPYLNGRLSVETIVGAPVELSLSATGTLANESIAPYALGQVPTGVPAMGKSLGTAKALPPIVTVIYRFDPWHRLGFYSGGGLSYIHVTDAKVTNPLLTEVTPPKLDVGDGIGVVLQGGVETRIYDRYFATLDVKAIVGMSMHATVSDIYIRTPELPIFEMAEAGNAEVDIGLTPLILTAGVGADF